MCAIGGPEAQRDVLAGHRVGAQRGPEAVQLARDRSGLAARDAISQVPQSELSSATAPPSGDGTASWPSGSRPEISTRPSAPRSPGRPARHLGAVDVPQLVALDRGVEDVLDERLDPLAACPAGVENAGDRDRAQKRAVLGREDVQERVTVRRMGM